MRESAFEYLPATGHGSLGTPRKFFVQIMTAKARVLLKDLKPAIASHTDDLQAEEFRVSWFAVTGLLRAVGHVLSKVDAATSRFLRRAIEEKWKALSQSKPEPTIFWGFIEFERNRFLKNYEHGIKRTFVAQGAELEGKTIRTTFDCGNARGVTFSDAGNLESRLSDGPYSGQSERKVAWEAYHWWAAYLDGNPFCPPGLLVRAPAQMTTGSG